MKTVLKQSNTDSNMKQHSFLWTKHNKKEMKTTPWQAEIHQQPACEGMMVTEWGLSEKMYSQEKK